MVTCTERQPRAPARDRAGARRCTSSTTASTPTSPGCWRDAPTRPTAPNGAAGRRRRPAGAKKGFDVLVEAVADAAPSAASTSRLVHRRRGRRRHAARSAGWSPRAASRRASGSPARSARRELLDDYRRRRRVRLACRVADDGDRDGIPNVLVEAMAAALPVVSTAVSGIPELVARRRERVARAAGGPGRAAPTRSARCATIRRCGAGSAHAGRATIAERFDGDASPADGRAVRAGQP